MKHLRRTLPIVLVVLLVQGCGTFMDLDELKPGDGTGDSSDSSDSSDTGTGTGTATDSGTNSGTDSESESITENPTATETDTPSQTSTETHSGTDTLTVSDTTSISESATETTTETASESVTVDTDTCDDATCDDFAGQCHPLCNGVPLVCPCVDTDAPFCVEHACVECDAEHEELCGGHLCGEDNACETDCGNGDLNCQENFHCEGATCEADLESGAACDELSDCGAGLDCNNDLCCQAGQTCCDDVSDCTDDAEPICDTALHYCVSCIDNDLCVEQRPNTPVCDDASGECVECVDNGDCRPDTDTATTEPSFVSPYGLCTPDNTCTCWVNSSNPTGSCIPGSCPPGLVCAEDKPGTLRFSCLRPCDSTDDHDTDSDSTNDFTEGLGCTLRDDGPGFTRVWAPPTTCHAYFMYGQPCSGGVCSIDGLGGISDGWCPDGLCTYSCSSTPGACPSGKTCGTEDPYSGACVP